MFKLLLLVAGLSAGACFNVTVQLHVLENSTLLLDGSEKQYSNVGCWKPMGEKNEVCPYNTVQHFEKYKQRGYGFFWYFRHTDNDKFGLIGRFEKGNETCNISPYFSGFISSCGYVLKVNNIGIRHEGIYKARIKVGKNHSKVLLYKVNVSKLSPVIVPGAESKHNLLLRCCDRNKEASTYFTFSYGRLDTKTSRRLFYGNSVLFTQMDAYYSIIERTKCCAKWHGYEKCGRLTPMVIDGSLCTKHAEGRGWCKNRGVKFTSFGVTPGNWKNFETTCSGENKCKIDQVYSGVSHVCFGKQASLIGLDSSGDTIWRKKRESTQQAKWRTIGINGNCSKKYSDCSKYLTLTFDSWGDAGTFRQKTNSTVDFRVTAVLPPDVMLELFIIIPGALKFGCNHSGSENYKIYWEIDGIYEAVVPTKNSAVLYLQTDCWYSNKHWNANARVRCRVEGQTWVGYSSYFYANHYRNGCNWRVKSMGFHELMKQYDD